MFFAKNSDRDPDEPQIAEWHARRPAGRTVRTQYLEIDDPGAHALLGSRPTWLWGLEHGVNEHRVAIGNEKIWTTTHPRSTPAALIGMDLVRLGLERAQSADDALEVITTLLEQHGQAGTGEPGRDEPYFSSFLVADPHGGWIVETSDRTWAARPVGNGTSISNRVTLGTDWTRGSRDLVVGADFDGVRLPEMPTVVADHRLAVTRAAISPGPSVQLREIAATLRDHTTGSPANTADGPFAALGDDLSGFTVCMHRRDSHSQTTASMIAELRDDAPLRAWICLGNPCLGIFVPVFPPAIAAELADPAQWSRCARLRDRVEGAPDGFADVRAALAPVEAELWERADFAFASGTRAALDEFVAGAFAPVDAVLLRLGV
jgi:dipeptidase